ncbi:hypothetical protein ACQ4LE_001641 [Meloidogyne hapla]
MPSTSKTAPQLSTTPLSTYGTRRSSTASTEFSPDSPGFGRVAKSNARLLNGFILFFNFEIIIRKGEPEIFFEIFGKKSIFRFLRRLRIIFLLLKNFFEGKNSFNYF